MVFLITIVFKVFLVLLWDIFFGREPFSFALKLFLSPWEIFFWREVFSFTVKRFLLVLNFFFPWDYFFPRETFSFAVRLFVSSWDFFFLCEIYSFGVRLIFSRENFSTENSSTQSENFWSTIQEGFDRICSLCLVLWSIPFCSLEKEKV